MKIRYVFIFFLFLVVTSCGGVSSKGVFGTGVSIAFDPRSVGTQIDDSIMQKNLTTRVVLLDKKYYIVIENKRISSINIDEWLI